MRPKFYGVAKKNQSPIGPQYHLLQQAKPETKTKTNLASMVSSSLPLFSSKFPSEAMRIGMAETNNTGGGVPKVRARSSSPYEVGGHEPEMGSPANRSGQE